MNKLIIGVQVVLLIACAGCSDDNISGRAPSTASSERFEDVLQASVQAIERLRESRGSDERGPRWCGYPNVLDRELSTEDLFSLDGAAAHCETQTAECMIECVLSGLGENIGGGCYHLCWLPSAEASTPEPSAEASKLFPWLPPSPTTER